MSEDEELNTLDIPESLLTEPFFYLTNLKISNILKSPRGFIKLLCVRSVPVKEDTKLVDSPTEWVYINQLYNIKVFDEDLKKELLNKWEMRNLTKSNLFFDYVILSNECRVGKFEGMSKNNYPIFWSRDYYYILKTNSFKLSLRN